MVVFCGLAPRSHTMAANFGFRLGLRSLGVTLGTFNSSEVLAGDSTLVCFVRRRPSLVDMGLLRGLPEGLLFPLLRIGLKLLFVLLRLLSLTSFGVSPAVFDRWLCGFLTTGLLERSSVVLDRTARPGFSVIVPSGRCFERFFGLSRKLFDSCSCFLLSAAEANWAC